MRGQRAFPVGGRPECRTRRVCVRFHDLGSKGPVRPPQTSYGNAATRTDRKSGITAQEGSFFPLGFGRQHKAKPGCPPPSPKWFHILCRVYRHAGGTVFRSGPRSVDTRVCPYRPKSMIRMERVDLRHDGRRPTTPGAAGAPVHGHRFITIVTPSQYRVGVESWLGTHMWTQEVLFMARGATFACHRSHR